MKPLALVALVFGAAIGQVTVAPLFPVDGAVPELVLLSLCLVAAFSGPVPVMVLTPLAAVMHGMLADRDAGLLLIAYLPVLPLGALLEDGPLPLGHAARTYLVLAGAGVLARSVLAIGAMLGGAPALFGPLLVDVLLPGLFLDVLLLTICYLPLRLAGLEGGSFRLQRGRYFAYR
ncbi:hypothetical protein [Tepidiforma thermophila]|uniref:Rod shape-determining protein MreD n=1 Tax=Tepidiforma thermophila (strain KCTC 52669 / CGMCC 1.13589 / G233) TaxID=2761530 RepID=A0A2A9HGU6_TEPT2|nr:hypothetical protein [Tepidiforma thermophila]PFG75244.1 hypothetical protein A9A59_2512 [Tepidiforma thermophila]